MAKLTVQQSRKAGLPPGSLIHTGQKLKDATDFSVFSYHEDEFRELHPETIEECLALKEDGGVLWINLDGLSQIEPLEKLGKAFNIHALVLEDILNTSQRPKLEDYGGYLYVVARMLYIQDKPRHLVTEQFSMILGKGFVLTFGEKEGDVFNPIRERLRSSAGKIRRLGADYLAYALLDAVVDNYFTVLENIGERIDFAEETLVDRPNREILDIIHRLKREMLFMHKAIWPLREVMGGLERLESDLTGEDLKVYLRDLYDHVFQAMDTTETYRDILSGMLDLYMSVASNRMNEVMKVLTIISTLFIPLTFLAGVYGMNFRYLPELGWKWAYPCFWGMCGVITVQMVRYFRKKKWL